jgi:hypothetical protein
LGRLSSGEYGLADAEDPPMSAQMIEEVEGYEDAKKNVRYRLVPFVW